jgi:hypothetical protein
MNGFNIAVFILMTSTVGNTRARAAVISLVSAAFEQPFADEQDLSCDLQAQSSGSLQDEFQS